MFTVEYDGKKYTIDDYVAMAEAAINGEQGALERLLDQGIKLRALGYKDSLYKLEDWLFFIARNGKTKWAIDKLYEKREKNNDNEAAIWALETGVNIFEKKGQYAPTAWYQLINEYYYEQYKIDDAPYEEHKYLMAKVGEWYKKGVKAGCDPQYLEGSETWCNMYLNSSNNKSTGGCYIATAVYGSYDCAEVWTLRRFRDEYLSKRIWGRCFIKVYYCISPKLVDVFGDCKLFNKMFKKPLDKMVERLNRKGVENTYYED